MKKFKEFFWSDEFSGYLMCLLPLFGAVALMPIWRDSTKQYFIGDGEAWFFSSVFYIITVVLIYSNYDMHRK